MVQSKVEGKALELAKGTMYNRVGALEHPRGTRLLPVVFWLQVNSSSPKSL